MYGGYGGYGGYGNYGAGYGSGYSSGYGGLSGYGGYGDRTYNQSQTRLKREDQNTKKQAENQQKQEIKPEQNEQAKQATIEQSGRKQVFQQYFKMLGGLRSILELGFAALALSQFVTTSSQLLKKLFMFTKEKGGIASQYIESKLNTKLFSTLAAPQNRVKVLKGLLLFIIRVFSFSLLILGIRMRREIKDEAKRKQEEMVEELQQIKDSQIEMLSQSEILCKEDDKATTIL